MRDHSVGRSFALHGQSMEPPSPSGLTHALSCSGFRPRSSLLSCAICPEWQRVNPMMRYVACLPSCWMTTTAIFLLARKRLRINTECLRCSMSTAPVKMKAYSDLRDRRKLGEGIKRDKISKQRRDVFEFCAYPYRLYRLPFCCRSPKWSNDFPQKSSVSISI